MIQSVQIQNFKSVVDLTLELGTFNVLIGANGCGKSNILEAIAFGAAASADKLDHEFLGSRGIRITSPEFMYSAFETPINDLIDVFFDVSNATYPRYEFTISYDAKNSKKWSNFSKEIDRKYGKNNMFNLLFKEEDEVRNRAFERVFQEKKEYIEAFDSFRNKVIELSKKHRDDSIDKIFNYHYNDFLADKYLNTEVSNYILYSPEQTSLRRFSDENQIYPLGIKGEGLFQYLKELSQDEKNVEVLNEIKECLLLLDWYEDFKLPQNLMSNEFALSIKDKHLNENLQFFDQRSTNEGFLFLLFYATLFTSKDTPQFFAIDNIDTSFNPKLCMQITKMLAALAKKHGKQVIVTTQNPAILDGLDLKDDSQRLFVVRRNEEGHTKVKRIEHKAERTMKLSEVWTNGFIGGLPDNF